MLAVRLAGFLRLRFLRRFRGVVQVEELLLAIRVQVIGLAASLVQDGAAEEAAALAVAAGIGQGLLEGGVFLDGLRRLAVPREFSYRLEHRPLPFVLGVSVSWAHAGERLSLRSGRLAAPYPHVPAVRSPPSALLSSSAVISRAGDGP